VIASTIGSVPSRSTLTAERSSRCLSNPAARDRVPGERVTDDRDESRQLCVDLVPVLDRVEQLPQTANGKPLDSSGGVSVPRT
jgi:hypothetical protein